MRADVGPQTSDFGPQTSDPWQLGSTAGSVIHRQNMVHVTSALVCFWPEAGPCRQIA